MKRNILKKRIMDMLNPVAMLIANGLYTEALEELIEILVLVLAIGVCIGICISYLLSTLIIKW